MSRSEALPTAALILSRNLHAEALQATVSEGLAQGPHVIRTREPPVERH